MSIFNFPNQRIPERKKTKQWHKDHIINYLAYTTTKEYDKRKKDIERLYYVHSAMLTAEEDAKICKMITERYGENFGPKYMIYPLAESIVEQVVGDYRLRPLIRRCLVNNERAIINKFERKMDVVSEKLFREANEDLQSNLGFAPETENPDIEIPDDIEEFFEKDYRTHTEEVGETVLYQLLYPRKESEKVYDLLMHYCISEHIYAVIQEKDGHPSIFIPHILNCFFEIDRHQSLQDDLPYFVWDEFIPINDIFNMFDLKEEDKALIEAYAGVRSKEMNDNGVGSGDATWYKFEHNIFNLRVCSMVWKSKKKIRAKKILNKNTGKEEYKILPNSYKERPRDEGTIESIEIDDIRHIVMVGPEVILSYGSQENQMTTVGNPKKRFINVVGLVGRSSIGTGKIRSLVAKLEDLQEFASEVFYEIRLTMRRIDGAIMVYDLANIPKEFQKYGEKALEKVNFYLKRDGVQYINSKDKRSNPYASSVNVSQNKRLGELINLLAAIEEIAEKISGVSPERRAMANAYQKASVAEMNLNASSARSEILYGPFNIFIERLFERLIVKSKSIYNENQIFTFFAGDNKQKFLQIFPDYFIEDLGVHVGNSRKEWEMNETIDQMATQTFANGSADPELLVELLKLLGVDNYTEKEAIFRKGIKALAKSRQENQQAMMQQEQQSQQAELQDKAEDRKLKREGYAKDIDVANIYANNKADDTREKEAGQDRRKLADIEKDLILANSKSQ